MPHVRRSLVPLLLLVAACAGEPFGPPKPPPGTVPKTIRLGMTTEEVVSILGSANDIARTSDQEEIWSYFGIGEDFDARKDGSVTIFVFTEAKSRSQSLQRITFKLTFDRAHRLHDFSHVTKSFDYLPN